MEQKNEKNKKEILNGISQSNNELNDYPADDRFEDICRLITDPDEESPNFIEFPCRGDINRSLLCFISDFEFSLARENETLDGLLMRADKLYKLFETYYRLKLIKKTIDEQIFEFKNKK